MTPYFAYGSNLDPVQMTRRCPDSTPVGRASVPGYALTFPVHSPGDWACGVASVEPIDVVSAGEPSVHVEGSVWGVLFAVSDADLAALDEYEAVDEGMYVRTTVRVHPERGEPCVALTFLAVRGFNAPAAPSRRYRDAIANGGAHHGLPAPYVAELRGLATND